jgi:putative ABC transport system permease protein
LKLIIENLKIALNAIFAAKSRSVLTALGIIIGILAVTLMGTLISGLDRAFEKSMSFLGKDVLFISKHEWFSDQDWWEMRNRPDLKVEYLEKLKELSPYVLAVAPQAMRGSDVSRDEKSITGVGIMGTTPEYLQTSSINIENGRFITDGEDRSGTRVTVIGTEVADVLFENEDPIEKYIKIGPYRFRVVGVIEKQGKFLGLFSMDNQAIIPFGTYQRLFSRRGWLRLNVKIPADQLELARDDVYGTMRRLRGLRPGEPDDFAINQQDAFERQYNMIKLAIGGTGVFITVLSLIVGGIGIMNIMFVSVTERTREIGIRKAIGATKKMILGQFLIEAVLICLIGGLLGLTLAFGASQLINKVFPSEMPVWLAVTALFLSVLVGVISGMVPSYRAANLDPIDALSYE